MTNTASKIFCACHSKKSYADCCNPFHDGNPPPTALLLMRSRYSAYANKLAAYIIQTTHPESPAYNNNLEQWKDEILQFCKSTDFQNLTILECIDGENEAFVTFTAHLKQKSRDATFTEKSKFLKVAHQWLYHSGTYDSK
ncbi:MAG: YchJ family protein domain [Chlamydiia bacterium]|nr:YchJ family protein domain [Chlamydiia bacterium]